jgi:predicted nuclease of predicted toxin-antitoxin system
MKLLLDHNLSPKLVDGLKDRFPGTLHVRQVRLNQASDLEVWEFARAGDFILVSKDSDFSDLMVLRGHPPKLVWLRVGNCKTSFIEAVLHRHSEDIEALVRDEGLGLLSLS